MPKHPRLRGQDAEDEWIEKLALKSACYFPSICTTPKMHTYGVSNQTWNSCKRVRSWAEKSTFFRTCGVKGWSSGTSKIEGPRKYSLSDDTPKGLQSSGEGKPERDQP